MKYTKSLATFALIASAGLTLSACGGPSSPSATSPVAEAVTAKATPTPSASPEASKSSRGNLVKAFGQAAGVSDEITKKQIVNFAINSIKPGKCTEPYAQAAVNGNIVLVDITVETTPDLATAVSPSFYLSGHDFKFIAANGTTFNGALATVATYGCIPDAQVFPNAGMGPGEKIKAKVVLDLPAPTGILVLKAPGSNVNGWEYKF